MLDSREEETKSTDFPLITFIKPQILDYFYNGDKFKILLVRLDKGMFKSNEEKNSIFQKLLSNGIETGNKNDKKTKKPKPKIEAEDNKAVEKENPVEEKTQKELQKEQLLKVSNLSLLLANNQLTSARIPENGRRRRSRGKENQLGRRQQESQRRKEARRTCLHQNLSLSWWRRRWRRLTLSTS